MKPSLLKVICGAVALGAGVVIIVIDTIALVNKTVNPMSPSDATAFLAFGVAALGILSLQRAQEEVSHDR